MSRFPPKFILREVARAAKERGLLEAADASVEVRRPRLPNVGTRKPAFPEDKFVKDALARFPILRDVPVALVTPLKDFPHPAKAFGTHRFKLWEMRQVTDRVSLLQTMKDFFWHPVEEQREWWRWALMVHDAGLARAYFPEAASLAKGSVDLDATPVASTSGVESGESAHGEAAAGVPAQEGATGPRSSGAESGSAVAAGTEDAGTGLRGPWWKEGTFQHSSLVSRTIVELAERLPTSGVEPPVCNMELLRRGSQYQEDGVLSTLSMVQDWEEEVLEDALVAQVMIHGKMKDFKAALESFLEREGSAREEVVQVMLQECKAIDLGLLAGMDALESLEICVGDLKSLRGFPALPSLTRLDVSDNKIVDGFEDLAGCPKLVELIVENNRVASMDAIRGLKACKSLRVLSLEGNPLAETDGYGEVWKVLPHLEVVDHKDQDGQEVVNDEDDDEDDDDEGGEGEGGDDEDEPGLEALYSNQPVEDDEEEYQEEGDEGSEDIEDDADEDEDEGPASKRAKYGGEGEEDDDGDD